MILRLARRIRFRTRFRGLKLRRICRTDAGCAAWVAKNNNAYCLAIGNFHTWCGADERQPKGLEPRMDRERQTPNPKPQIPIKSQYEKHQNLPGISRNQREKSQPKGS